MIIKYEQYLKENVSDTYFFQTYEETKAWLDSMGVNYYTINKDLTVDIDGSIDLDNLNLTKIPVQFGEISKSFYCANNRLINMKGFPLKIKNYLFCQNNPFKNINDLDSKILIKSIKDGRNFVDDLKTEILDDYFEHWVNKDISIVSILKDKVSDKIKDKYKHLFNANKFDLL